jgi:hypothetical protein
VFRESSLEFLSLSLILLPLWRASQKHDDIKIISASGGSVCGASHWFCSLKKTRLCFFRALSLFRCGSLGKKPPHTGAYNKIHLIVLVARGGVIMCLMCALSSMSIHKVPGDVISSPPPPVKHKIFAERVDNAICCGRFRFSLHRFFLAAFWLTNHIYYGHRFFGCRAQLPAEARRRRDHHRARIIKYMSARAIVNFTN